MTITSVLSRAWAHRKLYRGQCIWCREPLRDDATSRYCSQGCEDADIADRRCI